MCSCVGMLMLTVLLSKDGLDVQLLARALRNLPRLTAITVDDKNQHIGSQELIDAFGSFRPEDLLTCDGCGTLPVLMKGMAASGMVLRKFRLGRPISNCRMRSQSVSDLSSVSQFSVRQHL